MREIMTSVSFRDTADKARQFATLLATFRAKPGLWQMLSKSEKDAVDEVHGETLDLLYDRGNERVVLPDAKVGFEVSLGTAMNLNSALEKLVDYDGIRRVLTDDERTAASNLIPAIAWVVERASLTQML